MAGNLVSSVTGLYSNRRNIDRRLSHRLKSEVVFSEASFNIHNLILLCLDSADFAWILTKKNKTPAWLAHVVERWTAAHKVWG